MSNAIGAIALFATGNTVLFLLMTSSRALYGMSRSGTLPRMLSRVDAKRKAPWVAAAAAGIAATIFATLGDISVVAQIANFAVLVAFIAVNSALVWLRRSRPELERGFRVPLNVANVPVTAVAGIAFSLFMLANVGRVALVAGTLVAAAGLLLPMLVKGFGEAVADERESGSSADMSLID